MTSLRSVGQNGRGGISWIGRDLNFQIDVGQYATSVANINIENTQLHSLDEIFLAEASEITIINNPLLVPVSWPLQNCTTLNITNNGLLSGQDHTDHSIPSTYTFDDLETVSQSLQVVNTNLSALLFPKLTRTGSIRIASNPGLAALGLPILQTSDGSFELTDNGMLSTVQFLPELADIHGNLNITGNFANVSMPALNNVTGNSYISSSADISSTCNTLGSSGSLAQKVVTGSAQCFSENRLEEGSLSTGTSGNHNGLSGGAIAGIVIGVAVVALIGASIAWIVSKRRAVRANEEVPVNPDNELKAELAGGTWRKFTSKFTKTETPGEAARGELQGDMVCSELPGVQEPVELPAAPGAERQDDYEQ
ncbi:MAG: hypothetical protein Q9162_000630 [Coniocarpon cinnabarinum]